jgi:dihydrofolate reductase
VITKDIENEVRKLKNKVGKNIWLYGGASLTSAFMQAGLVDEFMLSVHPILLGKGKPLFIDLQDRVHLKLTDTKTYSSGLVQLYYQIDKK